MKEPVITLLTDFGLADHYVAAMRGVMLSVCPQARLVDISHEVTPFAIAEGAYTLAHAWKYFPKGTTHLAVVDPGVGSARRAIVAEVEGHRFVAPDNGLLTMVLEANPGAKVREITARQYFLHPVSNTFHGRDIFAPVAAHLAQGLALSRLGKSISDAIIGDFTKPTQLTASRWRGVVLKIDRFGNIVTNLDWARFQGIAQSPFRLKAGRGVITRCYPTYAAASFEEHAQVTPLSPAERVVPPLFGAASGGPCASEEHAQVMAAESRLDGWVSPMSGAASGGPCASNQLFALQGSTGYVEVSLSQASASAVLGVSPGAVIELTLQKPVGKYHYSVSKGVIASPKRGELD